ncbi:MAG: DNA-binding transcriptional regulator [Planctomycetota bacterium]
MSRRAHLRIAVLVDTATAWGRRINQGILAYEKMHGPWDVWVEPRGQNEALRLPEGWSGDGIIARVSSKQMAEKLLKQKTPVVNVSGIRIPTVDFPRVCTDNDKFAKLAVNHFVDRGLRHIAYVGLVGRAYSIDRQQSIARACEEADCTFDIYRPVKGLRIESKWERERASIGLWLKSLPKPVGILGWGVRRGSEVIEEAIHSGLKVPDEVAVLGDDDDLLCEAVQPSLSGVIVPSEQIGLEAATLLYQLMQGKKLKKKEIALEPTGIVARTSTDILAIKDQELADAIRLIRSRAHEPITVKEIAETLAISRRSLERKFQEQLHRTMGEEIARVHLERAKLLLATTDMQIPAVAEASGYGSPEYLATVVKRHTGLSPRRYREKCQGR